MEQISPKLEENMKSSILPTQLFREFIETSDRSLVTLYTPFSQWGENDIQMNHPLTTEGADNEKAPNVMWEESTPEPELQELVSAFNCF